MWPRVTVLITTLEQKAFWLFEWQGGGVSRLSKNICRHWMVTCISRRETKGSECGAGGGGDMETEGSGTNAGDKVMLVL